jgi:hypothetical protein
MDVYKALRELHEEKSRLDSAIDALEARMKTISTKGSRTRRGRRSMSAEERDEVSRRMSRYWASRRNKNQMSAAAGSGPTSEISSAESEAIREVA